MSASVSIALRIVRGHVASSVTSLFALTLHMRCVGRLRKGRLSSARLPRLIRCFGNDRLKVREARSCGRASIFGKLTGVSASPASGPPNKSFKPTPCRGVGHVLCATLARVRRPATGRLNSGVRRQKAFGSCVVITSTSRLRSALLFGLFVDTSLLRSSSSGALTLRMRCVARLRKQRPSICEFSAADPRLRTWPAEGSRGVLNHPVFGFRSIRPQFSAAGIRPA